MVAATSTSNKVAIDRVKIIEAFTDYQPPVDYAAITKRLLTTVPEKYLVGLDSVVICNLSGQPRKVRTGTVPSRGRKVRRERVLGLYHRAWRGERAWIQIFVDQIPPIRRFSWLRTLWELRFGQILYHELGHHAHTIRPEYREEEDVADGWSVWFMINHLRRAYWYLYPALWTASKMRKAYLRLNKRGSST